MLDLAPLVQIRELFSRAVELPRAGRDRLLAGLDPDMRRELQTLLEAHDAAGTFLDSGLLGPFSAGDRVGPYLIREELGRGGMGVVYRASRDDGEFEREVAIKAVGGRMFAPDAERRFLAERNILAALNHPSIVRMLEGGVQNRQRYLVMEYVAGQPITSYCATHALPLSKRLRLFQVLCSAIEYAHQRLILHRDLKAANILVTAEGDVKVLDFGIAQLLETDAERAGNTILHPLTPSCASPEQLRGEPLTLASDSYALGLLLYEILTGTNPQEGASAAQILQSLTLGPPSPPSKLNRSIPRDLEAIVEKCLAPDPGRRYASVADLSADVERFLENRPVIARPPSRLRTATRLCARNRAMTAVVGALLISIFAGAAAALWQAARAEHERVIAETRFENARRLISTVIHEIQPQLAGINGTVAVRKELVEKTLVYLEALWKDSSGNPALTRELIESYLALASVSADASTANVGDHRRASEILAKAENLAEALYHSPHPDVNSLVTLCHFYEASARDTNWFGSVERARFYARRAVQIGQKLAALTPGDSRSDSVLAGAEVALAGITEERSERIALMQHALAIYRANSERAPTDKNLSSLAVVYKDLASAWEGAAEYQKSLDAARQARALDEKVLQHSPQSPQAQMALAFDFGAIGWALYKLGQLPESVETLHRNVALREQIAAANPDDRRASDRLAYALLDLATLERTTGNRIGARRDLERTLQLYDRLSKLGPLVPQSLDRFALANIALSALDLDAGRKTEGCAFFHKSAALMKENRLGDPSATNPQESRDFRAASAICTTQNKHSIDSAP